MRFSAVFLFAAFILGVTASPTAQRSSSAQKGYIVKLKPKARQASILRLVESFNESNLDDAPMKIRHKYNPRIYNGFAGSFTEAFLEELKQQHGADIEYIEADGTMYAIGSQTSPPSWGLSRISQRKLKAGADYVYSDSAGAGVNVYVVDTGLQDHKDFGGRGKLVKSFVTGETAPDGNGHGTHCAGTIGSATYGVAKKANVLGVKVLNGQGSGTYSDVIAGINYVAENVVAGKTVMSMSLGGPKSQAVDDAMVAAIGKGVVAIVAAGNDGGDACTVSPAGAPGVFTVGASDNADKQASFSNRGSCVEIYAPGVNIMSLWKGADGATNTISGTSMATPHVAGVAALYMSDKSYTSAKGVYDDLVAAATTNVLKGLDSKSPNKLLFAANKPAKDDPENPTEPPENPTDPPTDPKDCDPNDIMCLICKMYPDFCKGMPGGPGGPGGPGQPDICEIMPELCQDGEVSRQLVLQKARQGTLA